LASRPDNRNARDDPRAVTMSKRVSAAADGIVADSPVPRAKPESPE
jgi:hypothetical protein